MEIHTVLMKSNGFDVRVESFRGAPVDLNPRNSHGFEASVVFGGAYVASVELERGNSHGFDEKS